MVPSLFWSAAVLVPISMYCYRLLEPKLLWIFLGLSLIPIFLPNAWLDRLRIGRTTKVYKRLGVHLVNKVTQNGELINAWVKKKHPEYRAVTADRSSVKRLVRQSYMFEKFHLLCFVFFLLLMGHAGINGHWGWLVVISVANIAYNVYPNLLQQYLRVRVSAVTKRQSASR